MPNDTLKLLEEVIFRLKDRLFHLDPECEALKQTRETLDRRVHEDHRENHALVVEVNGLLDSFSALSEYQKERRLFLGLQMGLELGGLDLLDRTYLE